MVVGHGGPRDEAVDGFAACTAGRGQDLGVAPLIERRAAADPARQAQRRPEALAVFRRREVGRVDHGRVVDGGAPSVMRPRLRGWQTPNISVKHVPTSGRSKHSLTAGRSTQAATMSGARPASPPT